MTNGSVAPLITGGSARGGAWCAQIGTFATAGSDGMFAFWDKDERQKIKEFTPTTTEKLPSGTRMPIAAASFNADGSLYAYAQCYDWSMVGGLTVGALPYP